MPNHHFPHGDDEAGGSKDLLELLDMRPALENPKTDELKPDDGKLIKDMTAKDCFEVIKKYYEG